MLGKVEKIVAIIDESCFCISASVLSLLTVVAAFMRYLVGKPIMWTEEIQMILVVWAVFFGGSVAFRERGHIAIDILFEKFPVKVQRVMSAVIWTIVTISVTWIGKLEVDRMLKMLKSGQSTTMLNIPRYIVYAVVAFACLLMLISHIICGIKDVQKYRGDMTDE